MITIHLVYDENLEIIGFRSSGHAGYADLGKDIVCSAVSTLCINTVNAIEELTTQDIIYEVSESTGLLRMKLCKPVLPDARLLFSAFELGIKNIEAEYGKPYLKVLKVQRASKANYKIIDHQEV